MTHQNKSDYPGMARVSLVDALNIAKAKYIGKPFEVELKKEDGYLVYEVGIVGADKSIMELLVGAGNGNILKMEKTMIKEMVPDGKQA